VFTGVSLSSSAARRPCCWSITEVELLQGTHGLLRAQRVDVAEGRQGTTDPRGEHRIARVVFRLQSPTGMFGVVRPAGEVPCL
jgi:hypothetical protein